MERTILKTVSLGENPGEQERFDSFFLFWSRYGAESVFPGEHPGVPERGKSSSAMVSSAGCGGKSGRRGGIVRNVCSVRRAGRGRPRLPGRGGWGETERRKTLIAHLKKEAAHLGFRHLACRDGDSAGLGIPDCGGGSETPSQNGFTVSESRRRRGGIDDGPGACLYRGLHRQCLHAWNVCGTQCAGFHDYGGGGAGRQTGLPDAGWRTRSSMRKLSRISDAAGCPEPPDENSAFPFRFPDRIS